MHLQGLNAVFYETATRLNDVRSHAIVHCVACNDKAFHRAPIVFRKALLEAESEWSQHNAKAVIDTKLKVGQAVCQFATFLQGYDHVFS